MPTITIQPGDSPYETATAAPQGWMDAALDRITAGIDTIPTPVWWITASLVIAAGLASSIRIALGRKAAKARQIKSDKFLTFLAAGVATGVVATGMWKFFGDVLNIANPYARVALFAFFEIAMLASAFRSRRFRLERAARRDHNPNYEENRIDVDGIAVWVLAGLSGLFAAADEHTTAGKAVRVVAPLLAAWMWERGLAGELMQFVRGNKTLNLRVTPERVLVWLGIAEPSGREVGEVDRRRRVAQFARTAHRHNLFLEQGKTGWRVSWTKWRLRRLTESANEHLKLATDPVLLGEVRAQLALLYTVEGGTSRHAVADLQPLRSADRLAISDKPFTPPTDTPAGDVGGESNSATQDANLADGGHANPGDNGTAIEPATEPVGQTATVDTVEDANAAPRKAATRRATKVATSDAHPTALKLAKFLAKYPGETNVELAKRMRVGDRTVSRYRADAEAIVAAQKTPITTPIMTPIPEPKSGVVAGVNGHSHTTPEEH